MAAGCNSTSSPSVPPSCDELENTEVLEMGKALDELLQKSFVLW